MKNYSINQFSHKENDENYWRCTCKCGNPVILSHIQINNPYPGCYECQKYNGKIAPYKQIFKQYKRNAAARDLEFDIDISFFKKYIQNACIYCNKEHSLELNGFKYNGIDRSDNTRGYQYDNCYTCCKNCNRAKNDLTVEEFNEWINGLVQKNKGN